MKHLILTLTILSLLGCQRNPDRQAAKFKTIMIKSEGEVGTAPDIASFYVNLECLNLSIEASKNCLVEKSNELMAELRSHGIAEDDIVSTSLNMRKSYTWRNSSNVFQGYESSSQVFVTLRDLGKIEGIYTKLLANPNLDLGGLNYSHSQMDSLKNEAYVNALVKAGKLSDKILNKLPEKEKEILKIGNVQISSSQSEAKGEFLMNARNSLDEVRKVPNSSVAISKGTIRVSANLFVEYQIK